MAGSLSRAARRLRDAVDSIAASVAFAPEVHARFVSLGFGPSPGDFMDVAGVAGPDRVAYFTGRSAPLGIVPGHVVAAVFGVFNPVEVVAALEAGWLISDRATVLEARLAGEREFLERVLADATDLVRATELLRRAADHGRVAGHPPVRRFSVSWLSR